MDEQEARRRQLERRETYIVKRVKDLITLGRNTFYNEEYRAQISDAQVLGVIVSKALEWSPKPIIEAVCSALEDANLHPLNRQFQALFTQNSQPMT